MVAFSDDFDRADGVLGANYLVDGAIQVVNRAGVNQGGTAGRAFYTATTPATDDHKLEAFVDCTTENTNSFIDLGTYGSVTSSSVFDGGVWARLTWNTSGNRTVAIFYQVPGGGAATLVQSLTLVATGTVVQPGYFGRMLDDGAVNRVQHLRVITRQEAHGITVAVYVNQPDDHSATLIARVPLDIIPPTSSTGTVAGDWFFGFGANSTASSLKVLSWSGEDYTVADRRMPILLGDYPTLEEVREQVKRRHSGAVNVNLDDEVLNDLINDAFDDLLQEIGDIAKWLIQREEVSLTFDSDGYATLPNHVEMPLEIEFKNQRAQIQWEFDSFRTSDGSVQIRRPLTLDSSSGTYIVKFRTRVERADADWEQLVWPRKYLECLVVAVAMRLAERDRSMEWYQTLSRRLYGEPSWPRSGMPGLIRLMKRDLNRYSDQEGKRFMARRQRFTRAGFYTRSAR